jgi:hypothetical protein
MASDSPRGQPLTHRSFFGGFKGEEGQKQKIKNPKPPSDSV